MMTKRYQQTKHALGSEAFVTIVTDEIIPMDECFEHIWAKVEEFEARFSRFRTDSELSQLNAMAGQKVPISPEFRALLIISRSLSYKTEGIFNPFILPALNQAGYIGSWPRPNDFNDKLNYQDRSKNVTIAELEINDGWVRIPKYSAIDLGGIGKGYLLDELGVYLLAEEFTNFWISLGGDILCSGADLDDKPWAVAIQHASQRHTPAAVIRNEEGKVLGIATSGVTKRNGESAGHKWHHIIDPSTGESAKTDLLIATVVASTATEADVYAKCAVILGTAKVEQLLTVPNIESIVVQPAHGESRMLTANKGVIG